MISMPNVVFDLVEVANGKEIKISGCWDYGRWDLEMMLTAHASL